MTVNAQHSAAGGLNSEEILKWTLPLIALAILVAGAASDSGSLSQMRRPERMADTRYVPPLRSEAGLDGATSGSLRAGLRGLPVLVGDAAAATPSVAGEPRPQPQDAAAPTAGGVPDGAPPEIVALVSQYDWPVAVVLRIIRRESMYHCDSWNTDSWGGGSHATGVMQILLPLHADLFAPGDDPFSCADNIAAGYRLYTYDGSNFRDWSPVPW